MQLQEALSAEHAALWLDPGGGEQRHSLWHLLTMSGIPAPQQPGLGRQGAADSAPAFVETPTAVVNMQRLLLGLCRGRPLLVKGAPGLLLHG